MNTITAQPILSASYPVNLAESGKFVVLDSSTLTGYSSAGAGKYAILTYDVTGGGSQLPYGADEVVQTNVTAGPNTIQYKVNGVIVKTRTYTYTNSGASAEDVLLGIKDV